MGQRGSGQAALRKKHTLMKTRESIEPPLCGSARRTALFPRALPWAAMWLARWAEGNNTGQMLQSKLPLLDHVDDIFIALGVAPWAWRLLRYN